MIRSWGFGPPRKDDRTHDSRSLSVLPVSYRASHTTGMGLGHPPGASSRPPTTGPSAGHTVVPSGRRPPGGRKEGRERKRRCMGDRETRGGGVGRERRRGWGVTRGRSPVGGWESFIGGVGLLRFPPLDSSPTPSLRPGPGTTGPSPLRDRSERVLRTGSIPEFPDSGDYGHGPGSTWSYLGRRGTSLWCHHCRLGVSSRTESPERLLGVSGTLGLKVWRRERQETGT